MKLKPLEWSLYRLFFTIGCGASITKSQSWPVKLINAEFQIDVTRRLQLFQYKLPEQRGLVVP